MSRNLFDRFAAALALVVLSPLMAVISVFIRREDAGPVIFRQQRVGRYGKLFTLYKFRTMRQVPPGSPLITAAGDQRVTRVGRKLRSTKADELPQFWNVVRGDMGLIGPRPEVPKYVELWPPADREVILSVRPGVTDPVTVSMRREEEVLAEQADPEAFYVSHILPEKIRGYVSYVNNRTLMGDLKIFLKTAVTVVRG